MYNIKTSQFAVELRAFADGIVRIRATDRGEFHESLLSRYDVVRDGDEIAADFSENEASAVLAAAHIKVSVDKATGSISVDGARSPLALTYIPGERRGYKLDISLDETERLFGLGDESRESIARRGTCARMDVKNVVSYGPIPFIMSSNGWGMLVNNTYAHTYDLGKTDPTKITVDSPKGTPDIYLFIPKSRSLADILELYTRVSGRAMVLPKSSYGYTFVLNEQTNAREMLWDAKMFRREDIPCDTLGLEPQWMSVCYDTSVEKKWDEDRFYLPGWLPENQSGTWTFFYNLREMGFKLSLWLCNDYDLLYEEEREADVRAESEGLFHYSYEGASILDPHFEHPRYQDNTTVRDEAWFDHLRKFVDNGAAGFKLDGAFQVNDHPDRIWGGKYFDDEVHNVYPVLYVKQMQNGFNKHTDGRRAFVYTACVYAGSQRYAASWAGDTGGGYDTVIAMLNYGLSGHVNVSCDMEVTCREGIHYGFLSPYTQQLGWRNWQQPWFLREELEDMIRDYAKLRSSLFPYIYSMAHKANRTGMPIARALSLVYPDHPEYDYVTNTYMLGDSLLVAVFDMNVTLPEGTWYDYFTGEKYEGGRVIEYTIPEGKGGALFVRAGGIIPMGAVAECVERIPTDHYDIAVYPGADSSVTLVEDDGYTFDYENGGTADTVIAISDTTDKGFTLTVGERKGTFAGREKREGERYRESDPEIKGVGEAASFTVRLKHTAASSVTVNGAAADIRVENGDTVFELPASVRGADAICKVAL